MGLCLVFITIFSTLYFAAQAQDQQGFISLDCGLAPNEPSPYTDPQTDLRFTSDAKFIQSGKIASLSNNTARKYLKPYTTLRYFPDGTRNCYDLVVIAGISYMITARFVYDNYDGLHNNPKFDLYIGSNKWTTIDLQLSTSTSEEIIHIPRSNSLEVCLVKTGTTSPMISALELRPLPPDTYVTKSGSLRRLFRRFLGNSDDYIRYPSDVYDRQWLPYFESGWTQINSTASVDNSDNVFEPPNAVFAAAATPANANAPLWFNWTLNNPDEQLYLYRHFAEIQPLRGNETREFNILWNGDIVYDDLRPPNLTTRTIYTTQARSCDNGECSMQLVRTQRSTLPPLLNAIEVFTVIQFPQLETDQNDVVAIKNIKAAYELSRISWQGDPCVPREFSWDGLNCNITDSSVPPRIISLNLSSSGLRGNISSSIQNLTQLQELDLSNNNLTGRVPEFLANMKLLLVINLSGNNFTGSVPQTLLDREKEGLKLDVQRNPELLCPSGSCKKVPKKKKFPVAIAASVASVVVILLVLVLIFFFRKKRAPSDKAPPSMETVNSITIGSPEPSIETKKRRFAYAEVMAMTNNFQRVLGKGGFGVVFHGNLNESEQVAVKMLSESSTQGYKQFKAEVELLLRVHHVNLVSLVGYCDERDYLALIYEYMPNGDLKQHLSGRRGGVVLNWTTRLHIALEAAQGLEYLHSGCRPPMIHRDVKSTNILLDDRFKAKIADFGLSKSFPIAGESYVSTVVAGTPGYLDPEYYRTNRLNERSDVYSFGIVLLETITNKSVIDRGREKPHITEWVGLMLNKGDLSDIVDPNLHQNYNPHSVWKAVELAMSCSNPSSTRRPNMSQVVNELNECFTIEKTRRSEGHYMDSKSSLELSMSYETELVPKAR